MFNISKSELTKLLLDDNKSIKYVAKLFNTTPYFVKKKIQEYDIELSEEWKKDKIGHSKYDCSTLTKEWLELKLFTERKGIRPISEELGVSYYQVKKRIDDLGIILTSEWKKSVKSETSANVWASKSNEECLAWRNSISEGWENRSEEEKKAYSQLMSNITSKSHSSDEFKEKMRNIKSGKSFSEEHRKHISDSKKGKSAPNRGIPISEAQKIIMGPKISAAWADKTDKELEEIKLKKQNTWKLKSKEELKAIEEQRIITKRLFGHSSSSKEELEYLKYLKTKYDDVIHQYTDNRYINPKTNHYFECDFYVPSKDLFIEYYGWIHGPMPYDPLNKECQKELLKLEAYKDNDKSIFSKKYDTWINRDVLKVRLVESNKLNMNFIYNSKNNLVSYNYRNGKLVMIENINKTEVV